MTTTELRTKQEIDPQKAQAFVGKVFLDTAGYFNTVIASIGDRLGLFKALATGGPASSEELARRAGVSERYTREWLWAMAAGGYVAYTHTDEQFSLPAEHAPALADEAGPAFFGGVHQLFVGMSSPLQQIIEGFRTGNGVPREAYSDDIWIGATRQSDGWYRNQLEQEWLPALPDVRAKLEAGARVADIGCGRGRLLLTLAKSYLTSRFVGYDSWKPQIDAATRAAREEGLDDRVSFETRDASKALGEKFDIVFAVDSLHDSADPAGMVRNVRDSLRPGGHFVVLEMKASDRLEENIGPLGSVFYGASVLHCMSLSLGQGGVGLGTAGVTEAKLTELALAAGFANVRSVPIQNQFNTLYELTAESGAR
jgi:protein-L-isoaspartate O-methyltransferase